MTTLPSPFPFPPPDGSIEKRRIFSHKAVGEPLPPSLHYHLSQALISDDDTTRTCVLHMEDFTRLRSRSIAIVSVYSLVTHNLTGEGGRGKSEMSHTSMTRLTPIMHLRIATYVYNVARGGSHHPVSSLHEFPQTFHEVGVLYREATTGLSLPE